jgi:NADH-quinone oxidoreductase subunit H
MLYILFEKIVLSLLLIVPLLLAVAFFTLAERKLMASIQRRTGPNVVGFAGLLQPFADGLKLIVKETIIPSRSHRFLFLLAPGYTFFLSLLPWAVIPFNNYSIFVDTRLSLIFIFTVSSLGVYGVLIAGWASNSRYAFLGAIRAVAQVISYELPLGLILVTIGLFSGSYNLLAIVQAQQDIWFIFPLLPSGLIFLLVILIETNRSPSDLPESESELVAGYSIDYSAIGFAMFFLGEYSNMLIMSATTVLLFFGGWLLPFNSIWVSFPGYSIFLAELIFAVKIALVGFYFIWIRATVPRIRYDFLLILGWKKLMPFLLAFFFVLASLMLSFKALPVTEFF